MNTFQYVAKDKNGQSVTGILEASAEAEVAEILHQKELMIISVKPIKQKQLKSKDAKIKLDDLVIFSRQLATMIDAGIPLVQALGILG